MIGRLANVIYWAACIVAGTCLSYALYVVSTSVSQNTFLLLLAGPICWAFGRAVLNFFGDI